MGNVNVISRIGDTTTLESFDLSYFFNNQCYLVQNSFTWGSKNIHSVYLLDPQLNMTEKILINKGSHFCGPFFVYGCYFRK